MYHIMDTAKWAAVLSLSNIRSDKSRNSKDHLLNKQIGMDTPVYYINCEKRNDYSL